MTERKVVNGYECADGYFNVVISDGSTWLYDWRNNKEWQPGVPPLPPKALGEVGGEPPAPDLGEWPGKPDVPPDTIRDVEIMTPHGACLAWYSSNDGWRAYATARECDPLIATRDVLRWRDLLRAVVEGGRVTGVTRD